MHLRVLLTSTCLAFALGANVAAQEQLWVDGANCPGPGDGSFANPYCTIAQGIAAAAPGDYVRVRAGVYSGPGNVELNFGGKDIHLWGEVEGTIIDGHNTNRILLLYSGETSAAEIFRFTFRNGRAPADAEGGAIYIEESSPTITGCLIQSSSALSGGGIYLDGTFGECAPILSYVTFENNHATGGGGGLSANYASPTLNSCQFKGNTAESNAVGGGALLSNSQATLVECTFQENGAFDGAGLYISDGSPTIESCAFTHNTAARMGGGLLMSGYSGVPEIRHCTFARNEAAWTGGGIAAWTSQAVVTNCLIVQNHALGGGGIDIRDNWAAMSPTFTNCTIADNLSESATAGAGINIDEGRANIINAIIWRNTPHPIQLIDVPAPPVITYSNVEGGWTGAGNIDADPRFGAGLLHPYYLRQLASGHADESPCADAGTGNAQSLPLLSRTTRRDQVADAGAVDMGFHAPIVSVPFALIPGDFNHDGRLDLFDFAFFQECYTGVEVPRSDFCWPVDLDSDFDVDGADYADWAQWITGP